MTTADFAPLFWFVALAYGTVYFLIVLPLYYCGPGATPEGRTDTWMVVMFAAFPLVGALIMGVLCSL